MKKHKLIFKRNMLMMLLITLVLAISIFLINILNNLNYDDSIKIGGSFSLTDQNGKTFNSSKLRKNKLIYFGYTFCPDVCPFDMLKLSKFMKSNPIIEKNLQLIFITVDPERDSPKELKSFLENFETRIIALTGTKEEIKNVTKNFRVFVKKNSNFNDDQNYLVDHSALIFLIDKEDNYIAHFRTNDFESKIQSYF